MTVNELLKSSMRLIGVIASGESLANEEAQDALSSLSLMLSTWSTENLLIYAKTQEVFPLVPSQQSYTMGPTGNFNTTRPQKIENASIRSIDGSSNFDLQIDLINQDQWNAIAVKGTSSNIPTKLFAQGTYPLETLYFWPVPSTANSLVLWSWKPLSSFASVSATVDLPPGYLNAIRYNLAIQLAPEYGKQPSDLVIVQAAETKAAVKRMNSKPQLMSMDAAIISQRPVFNYLTGE